MHSRVQWLEGERPTSFFSRLQHECSEKNHVTFILDKNENEVFAHANIEGVHIDFYTKLLSPEAIDDNCKHILLNNLTTCLTQDDRRLCDRPLSLVELADSVASLNTGKDSWPRWTNLFNFISAFGIA